MKIIIDGKVVKTYTDRETAIAESLIPCFQKWYDAVVVNLINKGRFSNNRSIEIADSKILSAMIKVLGVDKNIIEEKGLCEETIALAEVELAKPAYKDRKTRDLEEPLMPGVEQ